ncbi:ABC transporter ATP-binding protein [Gloeobacter kilaueensis]|uniref:Glutamine ABC transporter ATP-binding protein n=1 Tax=Gloeobacter kilaueensis (strain ATCC BAA-2537 / CCAP 1431/1 / ULC 316 / JS1) TaxID=1183438 RepID=U5QNJ5_GLOK1|nr:ABC transporter ATP-binding protein [Gloeobacter kilaueensis]AGY60496.1 glutamine ABC transporter ATP-binding protein [Gloeobacter kilaueensis JS1]
MLILENLSKCYKSSQQPAVAGVFLEIKTGVLGLLGSNGAGKTTLLQMLATVTPPTSGRIFFRDVDVVAQPDFLRQKLGYLPQNFGVYSSLTALEFLSYFAALKGISSRNRPMELLELVNLHDVSHRPAGTFSGGMKQRLGIAVALLNEPEVLIVDEPTAGLDPEERNRFKSILSRIGSERIVVFSTHIVSDIETVASEVAVLHKGRIIECASPEVLIDRARGQVWQAVIPSQQLPEVQTRYKVSSVVQKAEGVHLRLVCPQKPLEDAHLVEPTLEEAFLAINEPLASTGYVSI